MKLNGQTLQSIREKMPSIPLCVLGVGFYRVWTETVYLNTQISFPTQEIGTYEVFNFIIVVFLIILALLSKRIAPLCKTRGIFLTTGLLMSGSAFLNFISVVYPEYGNLLALPAVISGAIGISLIMMMWSEYYGCINPFRTAIYFSASMILGVLVLWVFKGLIFWWLCIGAMLVPFISLAFLKKSLALLPEDERPRRSWGNFQFPWKPTLLVALYSFAYGLRESLFYSTFLGPHSSFGVIFPSLLILVCVTFQQNSFKFTTIWKIALALILLSLLPVDLEIPFTENFSDFCALSSYTACLILIMVILSNLSYRYGVCALWLFAIERATRLAAVSAGLKAKEIVTSMLDFSWGSIVLNIAVVGLIIVATILVLSEKGLSSPWGVILNESPANEHSVLEKNRLGVKCSELAKQFELSQREEEILLLLAQKKKRSIIESELFIATSTYKTHVRHIYQKLSVHSKNELYSLLGVE